MKVWGGEIVWVELMGGDVGEGGFMWLNEGRENNIGGEVRNRDEK